MSREGTDQGAQLVISVVPYCKQSKHIICMKTKINIVVDLSSVDKIDNRFTPGSYPLSAHFGLLIVADLVLILINYDTMTPRENVHCRFMIYSVS